MAVELRHPRRGHEFRALTWSKQIDHLKMQEVQIMGGVPLSGVISRAGGGKNVAGIAMIAASMFNTPSRLGNLPGNGEVSIVDDMLTTLGVHVEFSPDRTSVRIDPERMSFHPIPTDLGRASRTSINLASVELGKFGKADVPLPGGDKLGTREIVNHLLGLQAFGARLKDSQPDRITFEAPDGLHGSEYTFSVPTQGGTKTLLLAAALADGESLLHNANLSDEVDELIRILNTSGTHIRRLRTPTGEISRDIFIGHRVPLLGINHEVAVDPTVAITYATAAIATESKTGITVKGLKPDAIKSFLSLLDQMGGGYEIQDDGIRFYYKKPLKAPQKTLITSDAQSETHEYLSIRTDWQPLISVLLIKAEGTSRLIESIFSKRFQHLEVAQKAGAKIEYFDPKTLDPTISYSFKDDYGRHGVLIHGGKTLQPINMYAGNDVRLGAFGLLMSLMIPGKSTITDVTQIRRGYDNLFENLQATGARINF